MSNKIDIPTFPVTGWNIAKARNAGILLLNVNFLASPDQKIEEPSQSGYFAIGRKEALELARAIEEHARDLPDSADGSPATND